MVHGSRNRSRSSRYAIHGASDRPIGSTDPGLAGCGQSRLPTCAPGFALRCARSRPAQAVHAAGKGGRRPASYPLGDFNRFRVRRTCLQTFKHEYKSEPFSIEDCRRRTIATTKRWATGRKAGRPEGLTGNRALSGWLAVSGKTANAYSPRGGRPLPGAPFHALSMEFH